MLIFKFAAVTGFYILFNCQYALNKGFFENSIYFEDKIRML